MDYNISVGVRGGAFDIAHVRIACKCAAWHANGMQWLQFAKVRKICLASAVQFGWICYLPLALICPPSMYLAHRTSNFVYSVRYTPVA